MERLAIRNRIGMRLFRRVFGIYCLIALLVTGIHAYMEYRSTKERVVAELASTQRVISESIAGAVWQLDMVQLDSILKGITEKREIVGASVQGLYGELLGRRGLLSEQEQAMRESSLVDTAALASPISFSRKVFGHSFDIIDPSDNSVGGIGRVNLYSHPDILIARVADTFTWIVAAAFLKTLALCLVFLAVGRRLISEPMERLISKVRSMNSNADLIPTNRGLAEDELQLLDQTFSSLSGELEQTLTELQAANDHLSSSNWQLQRAIEQSPTAITIFDRNGRVEYTNPSFSRITGYAPEEAQQAFQDKLYLQTPLKETMNRMLNGELPEGRWRGEICNTARDGSHYWVSHMLCAVQDPDGQITHFLNTAVDISQRKQAERALQKKSEEQQETIRKLESAQHQLLQSEKMASIGQLAAGVAHEINNPVGYVNSNLNSLRQYVEELLALVDRYRQGAATEPPDLSEAQAFLATIDFPFLREDLQALLDESHQGLDRVKKIIKDLKDFSHQDKGEWEHSDIRRGMESTLNVVWNELKYNCEVIREFESVPEIECMPSQLNQVFMNLLVNAAHAIEDKGTIRIGIAPCEMGVEIQIQDSGKGIAPEHLGRLFEPFFTTKPVGKGTGLGLSVSYGIVQKHNGTIEVESEPGNGTLFRIRLPLKQPASEVDQALPVEDLNSR